MIHPRFVRCIQIRSKGSQVKTQLVLWIFILFKVTSLQYRITTTRSRCILSLWDSFFELKCLASSSSIIYLWPDDGLVIEAETYYHLVTLNKINIHNTSCVLTCESLLLTCSFIVLESKINANYESEIKRLGLYFCIYYSSL